MENNLRFIPKMDDFLEDLDITGFKVQLSGKVTLKVLREEIENLRTLVKNGEIAIESKDSAFEHVKLHAIKRFEKKLVDKLKRVINATGIIVHTNLGRAPLNKETAKNVCEIASGYNNLEYSITDGERRSRMFYVEELLKDITGAEAAVVVNNNAAAVYLVLNAICKNKEVILSRGEIVEIGDSFRVSDIMRESGCVLIEAGTTNKTKISDYADMINFDTSALLKVHRSNFKIIGFTGEVTSKELVELKNKNEMFDLAVIEDMGSGVLADLSRFGFKSERTVEDALNDGVDIVTFSGDKLLGGPQAGVIVGKKEYIDLMKKNQMYRCLRIDKMCLSALEATLWQYLKDDFLDVPVIKAILEPAENIAEKANSLNTMLKDIHGIITYVAPHTAMIGGGTLPGETIDSHAVFITAENKSTAELDSYLRNQSIPIISTTRNDEIILDMRTVDEGDFNYIRNVFSAL